MVVLNLASEEILRGQLRYKHSAFPDGQQSIDIIVSDPETFYSLNLSDINEGVRIMSRMNSFKDVELIVCANQALKNLGFKNIELFVPYFLGARSDRKFVKGGVNYIKDVIAPIINLQGFSKVTVVDPHSDVLEACINNFEKKDNTELVRFAILKYWSLNNKIISDMSNVVFVSPDAGALKKVYKVSESFNSVNDVIVCSKHRDVDGKLSKTTVPLTDDVMDKDLFIVDDICDGGGTFINIAKEIKSNENFKGRLYLIVTHGIFSRGFEDLSDYFTNIFTTNSISGEVSVLEEEILFKKNLF